MMEKSVHILEMQEVQEPVPSKSDYLVTFIEKEESAFHVYLLICTCIHAKINSWFRGKLI